jgi:hypothetical protein
MRCWPKGDECKARGARAARKDALHFRAIVPKRRTTVLAAFGLLLAACGPDGANPFASFEARCAKLPSPRFEVVAVPVSFERDDSQPTAALTARSSRTPVTHRATGLTTAAFGQNTDIELQLLEDRRGARACGTPQVRVELSMQPITVLVARELADLPCQHEVTLSHEMKHVAVYVEVLHDAAQALGRELPEAVGMERRRAASALELQQQLNAAVRDELAEFMRGQQRILEERQAEIDSPEEYARVSTACRTR